MGADNDEDDDEGEEGKEEEEDKNSELIRTDSVKRFKLEGSKSNRGFNSDA